MKQRIITHLTENPSYLKKGPIALMAKYGCKEVTIKKILRDLAPIKRDYISSLKTLS